MILLLIILSYIATTLGGFMLNNAATTAPATDPERASRKIQYGLSLFLFIVAVALTSAAFSIQP